MVDSWFLMSSPVPVLTILGFYLYFVLKLGPQLMATRKALNLQKILVAYNFYQVLFSLWLCSLVSKVHRLTYFTPRSRVLLEKLIGSAASQEIPRIFGTRKFLTVLII
jgi:hypothetical protein